MLDISRLSKAFPGQQKNEPDKLVLNQLSFQVMDGEFVSIVGPSGSGKSTLFEVIGGLQKPDEGDVYIKGVRTTGLRGQIAYMPQQPALLPWRTVSGNIELALTVNKMPKHKAKQMALEWLQRIGLDQYAKAYPYMLSGGMQQRVSFLRALLSPQPLMLLDEPFGALDALTRMEMQQWLLSIWEQNRRSVLFVTHSIEEALLLSDRIIVLSSRPAQIIEEIPVPFSRPRSNVLWTDQEFNALKGRIYAYMQQEKGAGKI